MWNCNIGKYCSIFNHKSVNEAILLVFHNCEFRSSEKYTYNTQKKNTYWSFMKLFCIGLSDLFRSKQCHVQISMVRIEFQISGQYISGMNIEHFKIHILVLYESMLLYLNSLNSIHFFSNFIYKPIENYLSSLVYFFFP